MATQAKVVNLTFINVSVVVDEGEPTERVVQIRWAVNLSDSTTPEVELALDLQNGTVKPEQVTVRVDSIRANVTARSTSGKSKEQLLAELAQARGAQAPVEAPVNTDVEDDSIPF